MLSMFCFQCWEAELSDCHWRQRLAFGLGVAAANEPRRASCQRAVAWPPKSGHEPPTASRRARRNDNSAYAIPQFRPAGPCALATESQAWNGVKTTTPDRALLSSASNCMSSSTVRRGTWVIEFDEQFFLGGMLSSGQTRTPASLGSPLHPGPTQPS